MMFLRCSYVGKLDAVLATLHKISLANHILSFTLLDLSFFIIKTGVFYRKLHHSQNSYETTSVFSIDDVISHFFTVVYPYANSG